MCYDLGRDEKVVYDINGGFNDGKRLQLVDEIILTNKNIIYLKKNFTGRKVVDVKYFSHQSISIYGGQPQIQITPRGGLTELNIYYNTEKKGFVFSTKKEALEFARLLNELVVLGEVDEMSEIPMNLSDGERLKEQFRDAFGILGNHSGNQLKRIAISCPSCGARLSGYKGKTIKCPYCDSSYDL